MRTFIKTVGFILILSFVLVATSNKAEKIPSPVKTAEEIFEAYNGAVFRIKAVSEERRTQMSGTGFFIDENGTALTAAHVVIRCDEIEGFGGENESLGNFEIIKTDIKNDIALIRIKEKTENYTYLEISKEIPDYGEKVYVIGFPYGESIFISDGVVSTPDTKVNGKDVTMLTIPITNGVSGGPIISATGKVVGVASAILETNNSMAISPTLKDITKFTN